MKPRYRFAQKIGKIGIFIGLAHAVHAVLGALHGHLAQHHFRMPDEIAVHADTVFIRVQMHPIRLNIHDPVTLLKKEDVTGDLCSGIGLERCIRQTDRSDEVGALRQIFAHGRILLIHRAL